MRGHPHLRSAVAWGAIVLLAIAEMAPLPWAGAPRPPFLLAAVYYAAIYRPGLAPFWAVFVLGVVRDALLGLPIGAGAAALIAVRWAAAHLRRFLAGQDFVALWAGFVLAALGAQAATWSVAALLSPGLPAWGPAVAGAALGVALFPLLSLALHRAFGLGSELPDR